MRYKNIIIRCSDTQELLMLQKHLFAYKYVWFDSKIRNRQIRTGNLSKRGPCCIILRNDDILKFRYEDMLDEQDKVLKTIDYKQFIRREKLKNINKL